MRVNVAMVTLGAALFPGLIVVLAALILPACGVRLGVFGKLDFCPSTSTLSWDLEKELEQLAVLEDRLRGLERRLAGLPACPPRLPLEPPPELRAELQPPPEPDPDMLDAEKWAQKDLTSLEGCWSLASDFSVEDVESHEVTEVASLEMCFDENGNGEKHLVMTDAVECEGEVWATYLESGMLQINDREDIYCTDGSYVYRGIADCELEPNGEAACTGRNPGFEGETDWADWHFRIMNRTP